MVYQVMNVSFFLSVLTEILILIIETESLPRRRWRSNSKYNYWHNPRSKTVDGCFPGQCVQSSKCPRDAISTKPTDGCAYWSNGPWVCCRLTNDSNYNRHENAHGHPTKSTTRLNDGSSETSPKRTTKYQWTTKREMTSTENKFTDSKHTRHTTPSKVASWGRNLRPTPVGSVGDLPVPSWERPNVGGTWNKHTKYPSSDGSKKPTVDDWNNWTASHTHNSRTTKRKTSANPRIVFPTERATWTQKTTKHPTSSTIALKRTTKLTDWKTTPKSWGQTTAKPWGYTTAKPWSQTTRLVSATRSPWGTATKFPGRSTPKITRPSNTRKPTTSISSTQSSSPTSTRVSTTRSRNRVITPLPDVNTYLCGIRDQRPRSSRRGRNNDPFAAVGYTSSRNSTDRRAFQRIVGGEEVEPFSWPWVAALYKVSSSGVNRFSSAGSLINENFILTAAHPFTRDDLRSASYLVMLGTHNAQDAVADYMVSSVILHPRYEQRYYYHDIALLRLERPVVFNDYVMPVCLPSPDAPLLRDKDLEKKNVTVMGWGDDSFGGKSSRVLKEATFPIISRQSCNASYVRVAYNRFPRGITENMLCAGHPEGGKDACQGDSGGPLTSVEHGRYTQVGIVSFGYQCGDKEFPGVYTKVAPYLSWIAENTERAWDYNYHDYDYEYRI